MCDDSAAQMRSAAAHEPGGTYPLVGTEPAQGRAIVPMNGGVCRASKSFHTLE